MKKRIIIKVLYGKYKNTKINFYIKNDLKPTKSIIKKSLFEKIRNYVKNKKCLDLFSGSGSLGFESISLGASNVYFNDINNQYIKNIKKNSLKFKTCKMSFFKKDFKFFF